MKQINRTVVYGGLAIAFGLTASPVFAAPQTARENNRDPNQVISQSRTARNGRELSQIERANQLLHKEVTGQNNEKLGSIDDVVVDLTSGHVLYAVMNTSNGKVAVPPGLFRNATAHSLQLNTDKATFSKAPKFTSDLDNREALSRADFVSQVYQQFGEPAWWQGSSPASAGSFQDVHKISKLIGTDVVNVNDQPVGQVNNVALDVPAGRVLYVILSPDKDLNLGNNLYALPPDAFTLNKDQKRLTSDLDQKKLASAPHFNRDDWSRISDPSFASEVYKHYGKQAYFEQQPPGLQPTGRENSSTYNK